MCVCVRERETETETETETEAEGGPLCAIAQMEAREQLFGVSFLFAHPGFKLRSSGWHGKHFYPLSYLSRITTVFVFLYVDSKDITRRERSLWCHISGHCAITLDKRLLKGGRVCFD